MPRLRVRLALSFILLATALPGADSARTSSSSTPSPAGGAPTAATPPTPAPSRPRNPPPTLADVAYGEHARQTLDFWRAASDRPTPVVIHMHGGGWIQGDKSGVRQIARYLAAGISVVSINYRYTTLAQEAGAMPPVAWPMHDAARAVQYVRAHAAEWKIDPVRIGGTGGSAGACTMLWLAFHADLAQPASADPVARQSTRLFCVAVDEAQTSLDPAQMAEWTPNSSYGGHAFGFPDAKDRPTREALFQDFLKRRAEVLPWIREYSPLEHVSSGDPPVYLFYRYTPGLGQPQPDPTHTSNFGLKLQEKLAAARVPCELVYPGTTTPHEDSATYLIAALRLGSASPPAATQN